LKTDAPSEIIVPEAAVSIPDLELAKQNVRKFKTKRPKTFNIQV
jgi:hypothetical protein